MWQGAATGNPLAARVTLVSGEELVTQPAKDSLDNDNLPTVPDHLKGIVKCMLKRANQVYACVCVFIVNQVESSL